MSLAFPVVGALALGLVLGGRLGNLAELRLRAGWLFFVAIVLQVVAFPFAFLPWTTDASVATLLWLTSYGFLVVAVFVNRRITGVPIVALGMCMNVAAIVANGGTMPVGPSAMHDAGRTAVTQANSTAVADPRLEWLVDRWAAPEWIPLANVFSIGDVVIAAGAVVIVLHAMGVRPARLFARRGRASLASCVAREALGDAGEHLHRDRGHVAQYAAKVAVDDHERPNL